MLCERLRREVCAMNLELPKQALVTWTSGNVSGRDPDTGYVVIKPSGIGYDALRASDLAVVDLDGKVVEGRFRPSSDTPTHLALYRAFKEDPNDPELRRELAACLARVARWRTGFRGLLKKPRLAVPTAVVLLVLLAALCARRWIREDRLRPGIPRASCRRSGRCSG